MTLCAWCVALCMGEACALPATKERERACASRRAGEEAGEEDEGVRDGAPGWTSGAVEGGRADEFGGARPVAVGVDAAAVADGPPCAPARTSRAAGSPVSASDSGSIMLPRRRVRKRAIAAP